MGGALFAIEQLAGNATILRDAGSGRAGRVDRRLVPVTLRVS